MDDIPIGLFNTRKEALTFARKADDMPTQKNRQLFNTDCSTPVGIGIAKFVKAKTNAGMFPQEFEMVRIFEDEDEPAAAK
jgi:hypothetical protein